MAIARRRTVLLIGRDGTEMRSLIAFPPPAVLLWNGETYGRDERVKRGPVTYRWVTSASASVKVDPEETSPLRWHATISYKAETNYCPEEHDLEELEDLHDIVEKGPDWNLITKIELRLNE